MVKSVSHLLETEFGRSLSDSGVHLIDPFVGTGNFIVRLIQAIDKTAIKSKYSDELHCNEVLLMPYYIASMNIEHEFYVATDQYQPFDNLCPCGYIRLDGRTAVIHVRTRKHASS